MQLSDPYITAILLRPSNSHKKLDIELKIWELKIKGTMIYLYSTNLKKKKEKYFFLYLFKRLVPV